MHQPLVLPLSVMRPRVEPSGSSHTAGARMPGVAARIADELVATHGCPADGVRVVTRGDAFAAGGLADDDAALDDPAVTVWAGASAFADAERDEALWITREEYDEYGPAIVHRKCVC